MADESQPALPGSFSVAWGLRERPGKGPKPGLSLDQIIRAGLAVAAADGLAAVSMSRVATELGVGTMSLYRYVESKQELLDLMVDVGLGSPPEAGADTGWRDGMAAWAWAMMAAYRSNLWAVQVPLSGPPATPNALRWLEQALSHMRGTRLDPAQKMSVILLVANYVRYAATMQAQLEAAVRVAGLEPSDLMAGYNKMLTTVLDQQRFPELLKVAESGVMGKADEWDEEFSFGLDRILDGVDVLVRSIAGKDEP